MCVCVCTGVWKEGALVCKLYQDVGGGWYLTTEIAAEEEQAASRERMIHDLPHRKILGNAHEAIIK